MQWIPLESPNLYFRSSSFSTGLEVPPDWQWSSMALNLITIPELSTIAAAFCASNEDHLQSRCGGATFDIRDPISLLFLSIMKKTLFFPPAGTELARDRMENAFCARCVYIHLPFFPSSARGCKKAISSHLLQIDPCRWWPWKSVFIWLGGNWKCARGHSRGWRMVPSEKIPFPESCKREQIRLRNCVIGHSVSLLSLSLARKWLI